MWKQKYRNWIFYFSFFNFNFNFFTTTIFFSFFLIHSIAWFPFGFTTHFYYYEYHYLLANRSFFIIISILNWIHFNSQHCSSSSSSSLYMFHFHFRSQLMIIKNDLSMWNEMNPCQSLNSHTHKQNQYNFEWKKWNPNDLNIHYRSIWRKML